MKIIINENENYDIEIPNEIQGKDFLDLIDKLMKLSKFIQISSFSLENKPIPKLKQIYNATSSKNSSYPLIKKHINSKERALDLLQYLYHGSNQDKLRIQKLLEVNSYNTLYKRLSKWKEKYNIQPQEVGFYKFGNSLNPRGIKINDWTIKSYTGFFDEKENGEDEK